MLVLCHPKTILPSNVHYFIPKGSSKSFISVGDSSMIKAIFLQCDFSYSSQVITTSSFFFGRYFLRNNSSLTSLTELNFGFPYRAQVNFSMTLNSSSCISSENPMSPNTVWAVLSFSCVMDEFFLFLKTLQYSHCQQKHGMLVRL